MPHPEPVGDNGNEAGRTRQILPWREGSANEGCRTHSLEITFADGKTFQSFRVLSAGDVPTGAVKGSHGFEQIGLAFPVEDVGIGDAAAVGVQTVEQSGRHHDVGWSPASARQLTEALAVIIFSRRLENPSF